MIRSQAVAIVLSAVLVVACDSAGGSPSPAAPASAVASAAAATSSVTVAPTASIRPSVAPTPTAATSAVANATGWVACQCGIGGRETLYLLRPDGSDEHQILADVGGDVRHPDFSPDGRRLAFDHLADEASPDEVWVAAADGSGPKLIPTTCPIAVCLGIWEPAWSPDGSHLAAILEGGPLTDGIPASFGVAIVDVATGRTRKVVEQASSKGQLQFPRWSPDGKRIVFWNETDTPSTWIVGTDGKGLRQLTEADLGAGDPDWSPDGRLIVVSTRPLVHFDTGPSDLYAIAPDGTGLTKLTDSVGSGARFTQPRWSPDGTAILYTREAGGRKIWAMTPDGSTDGPIPATTLLQTHPTLQSTP